MPAITPDKTPMLNIDRIGAELADAVTGPALNLLYLQNCQSTNIECLNQLKHNTVVIAESQTAGRGRRGKQWYSASTENIYCSIGLYKSIKAEFLGLISLLVGVCIVQVLRHSGYSEVTLKWPNDILYQGKKLGGILIESKPVASDKFFLVIGFGINVNLDSGDIQHIDQPATGLKQIPGNYPDRQQLLSSLIRKILQEVMNFDQHLSATLISRFNQLDSLQGKQVQVKTVDSVITGTYLGILQNGEIQLQTPQGLQSFASAEISLRGC